jgi:uncharacterized damage-inducible protein DinB
VAGVTFEDAKHPQLAETMIHQSHPPAGCERATSHEFLKLLEVLRGDEPMAAVMEQTQIESMLNEFREEAATTKRVLERVPADKLTWRPHPKSMSLGQLALHVAATPGNVSRLAQQDSFDVTQAKFDPPLPNSLDEILATHEQTVAAVEKCLQGLTDEQAGASWRLMRKEQEIFCKPRISVMRTIMLNHWYHHRGQLSVYLRLLDIPIPVIYGRSADENPFE